ncbi:MAG: hypothetical protein JW839_14435 [Candidatus Lokiarchaeota archaeon]|nr:hypothetical protein [Candidatus Lokiarchaeota archaeon]
MPASMLDKIQQAFVETSAEYPAYIKKVLDLGVNYINLAIYKVDDGKLADALKAIGTRYHKVAARVPEFSFEATTMLEMAEWAVLKK